MYLGAAQKRIACHTHARAAVIDGFPQTWDSVIFSDDGKIVETLFRPNYPVATIWLPRPPERQTIMATDRAAPVRRIRRTAPSPIPSGQ